MYGPEGWGRDEYDDSARERGLARGVVGTGVGPGNRDVCRFVIWLAEVCRSGCEMCSRGIGDGMVWVCD